MIPSAAKILRDQYMYFLIMKNSATKSILFYYTPAIFLFSVLEERELKFQYLVWQSLYISYFI